MMWGRSILLLSLVAAGCSEPPSPAEAYDGAWTALREGRLEEAGELVASAKDASSDSTGYQQLELNLLEAEILLAQGHASQAHELLETIPDPGSLRLRLRWLVDRAEALFKTGHGDVAIQLLEELDAAAGDSSAESVLRALLLRSAMEASAGRFDEAEALLRTTASRADLAGDTFHQAAALLNFSFLKLRSERFDESLDYSHRAFEAAESAGARRLVAAASNNMGIAYTVLGNLTRAQQYLTAAVDQLREIGDLRNLQDALGELGNAYLRSGQPELGQPLYREAVEIAEGIHLPAEAGRWAGQLAFGLVEQQQWSQAAEWNQRAYDYYRMADVESDLFYLELNEAAVAGGMGRQADALRIYREVLAGSEDDYLIWNAHVGLASELVRAGRVAEGAREYESALAVIEAVRSSLLDADSRIRYHDLKMKFFKDYVDLLVTEGQTEQALQVAEYSRGRVLAENLGVQSAAIGEVRTAALQRYAARTGQVLLSFWLAPHRSFVWVIHPDQILLRELPGEDEIGDLVSGYRQAIEVGLRDPLETGLPIAQRLSATLLTPIQDDIANADSIVIVLDGALHALNLDTLLVADGQQYWIEQAELSIAPSLSVLADRAASVAAENTSDERRTPSLLLIGAPEPPDPRYPALPEASTEIEAIRKHFEGAKAVVLTGSNATPSSFLDAAPEDFSMIHFAAHAEANPESPLESAVILSEDDDRYKLYAHDIAGLELSADLVTISACYAAGSRFYGGEGLVGFAWAFLQSGAHSVVAGLWDVGDAASSHLMDRLYEGIAAGMTPSEALREAKLSLLRSDGAYRKPFYWAPYQTYLR